MSDIQLPSEWRETTLECVGGVVTGKTPSKKNPDFFGGTIPFIKPGDVNDQGVIIHTEEHLTDLGAATVPTIPLGAVVVTCIGNLGRCAITSELSATNQQINSVIPDSGVNVSFIYYQLRTLKEWMLSESSATTVTIINKSKFSQAPIVLPPLAEQMVIADKLDTLLAQVETTKARLERIPEILKSFRQSVLTAAVSGKLTEKWRKLHTTEPVGDIVEQQTALKKGLLKVRGSNTWKSESELFELPANWAWIENYKLAVDQSNAICAGPFGTIFKAKDFRDDGVPIIFLRHVKETGFNQDKPTYMDSDVWKELHQDYSVYGGELLVTKLGDPPGECCVYPSNIGVSMVTPDVLKMTVDEDLANKDYLRFFFNSPLSKKMVEDAAFGATRLRIDMALFKLFPVPLAPREEQTEIVRRVEELFAFADSIEQKATAALARVNNLTQSILAKAFRGELTADWRAANPELISGDNSAEALLEKIKIEREVMKKQPKPKRTAVKKKTGSHMSKQIIKVIDALEEAGKPLSGQQLLAAAGYPSDCGTEQLEQFFLDIRKALISEKSIVKLQRGDDGQDWFALAQKSAKG